jgi:hypothetical protein
MQLHSLIVSEPSGVAAGFGAGMVAFYLAKLFGCDLHTSMLVGCGVHFLANAWVAGNINLALLDFLSLALRLPASLASAYWMNYCLSKYFA